MTYYLIMLASYIFWIAFISLFIYMTYSYYIRIYDVKKLYKNGKITKEELREYLDFFKGKHKSVIVKEIVKVEKKCSQVPKFQYNIDDKHGFICNFVCDGNCHFIGKTKEELLKNFNSKI
jgi:hypothetical protein